MKPDELYQRLEKDFITSKMSDEWSQHMAYINDFLTDNYKKRSMGLVCDFAKEIKKVYTAVFPSEDIMRKILDSGASDAMFFIHHPAIWDIRRAPEVFQQMNPKLLQQFKERKISIYNLHVPLDHYGEYSTGVTLAKALDTKPKKAFVPYFGSLCGVIAKTSFTTIEDLRNKFQEAVGHKVSLYKYGDDKIKNKTIAIIAGGGNQLEMLKEIAKAGINTFVTGITAKNNHSKTAHEFLEKNKINVLGGTHYSTEKFSCIAMVDYFKKIGLAAEFVEDKPVMEDM